MNTVAHKISNRLLHILFYGIILAIPLAFYLITYDSCQIKITLLHVGAALIVAFWLIKLIEEKKVFNTYQDYFLKNLPVLMYFIVLLVGFLVSPYPASSLEELIRIFCYIGIYFVVITTFHTLPKIRIIARLLITAGVVAIIYGFIQLFGLDPFAWSQAFGSRIFSTFGNPNFYAAYLVLIAPLILSFFFKTKIMKYFYGSVFLLLVINIYLTNSKGGWIGFIASLVFFTILITRFVVKSKKVKTYLVILTVMALLLGSIGVLYYSYKRPDSIRFRLLTWESTLQMIKVHPIVGNGLNTFRIIYPAYRHREIFRIEGKHQTETQHPENEFLEVVSDSGILGFGIFMWMLITIFNRSLKTLKEQLVPPAGKKAKDVAIDKNPKTYYLIGFIAGFLGLLVHNLFCVNLRFVSSGFFFWVSLGILNSDWQDKEIPLVLDKNKKILPKSLKTYFQEFSVLAVATLLIVFFTRLFMANIFHNLAIFYSKNKMWDEAIKGYKVAMKYDPFFVMPRYFLGNVYNDRWAPGDDQRALAAYDEVVKMAPNYVMVHYQRGIVFSKMQQWDKSIQEFEQAIKLDPVYAHTYFRLGLVYININDLDKALVNFMKAAEVDPTISDAYVNAGNIYLLRNNFNEAEKNYQKAIEINPDNANAHRNYALLLTRSGRKTEAIRELETLKRLSPGELGLDELLKKLKS